MKIVDGSDKKAIERLLMRADADDPAFDRRVRRIVNDVRTGGDRALTGFARRYDRVTGPIEVTIDGLQPGRVVRVDTSHHEDVQHPVP